MTFLESLSNINDFRFVTFLALDDVDAPSPIYPNGKCPLVRGALEDDPGISMSIGFASSISS
jgi:hypothetical protein